MRLLFKSFLLLASLPLLAEESVPLPKQPALNYSINAKARADDYIQAFDMLRKEKTAGKVQFVLKDGSIITNIIDIQLMQQGSLMIFRFNSPQGIFLRVVALEEILRLEHV